MLRTIARLLSRCPEARLTPTRAGSRRCRPRLEALEDRTVLSTVFLVAPDQPTDATHSTNLLSAIRGAGPGGTVVVEPGSVGGFFVLQQTNTPHDAAGITIMGDPSAGTQNLPSFTFSFANTTDAMGNVTSQGASGVTLEGLNLGDVSIFPGANGERVLNNLVSGVVFILGGASSTYNNGNNVIAGNTIYGSIFEPGFSANDQIVNNTVNASAEALAGLGSLAAIDIHFNAGVIIRNNTVNVTGAQTNTGLTFGIRVADTNGAIIDSNTVDINLDTNALTATPTGRVGGIEVVDSGATPGTLTALVQLNAVSTNNLDHGIGLRINDVGQTNARTAVTVQGNDFHGNAIGVQYNTDSADATPFASTLGGTAQAGGAFSLGGNDFRQTNLAIQITTGFGIPPGAPGPLTNGQVLAAQLNIFAGTPNVFGNGGAIDTSNQLSNARAFVQILYEKLTGNVVGLSQLDGWVGFLTSFGAAGQEFVTAEFQFSTLGLGRLVDTVAQQLVGHPLDATLRGFLMFELQSGASLESVGAQIIAGQDFFTASGGNPLNAALAELTGVTANQTISQFLQQLEFLPGANGVQGAALQIEQALQPRAQAVDQLFMEFYHRAPSANELSFNVFQGGALFNIELGLLSTQEFFNNA